MFLLEKINVYVNFPLQFFFLVKYITDSNYFWTSTLSEQWSEHNVCEWLQFCYYQYKLDFKCISFSHFDINYLDYATWPRNSLWMLQAFVENTCITSYRI
uniref:PNT domain-containing protein n=1 Tax=Junco hyemalis TaxID=40217 RepID=A0A8C5J6Y6_JUNHY